MVVCPSCGTENPEAAKFCLECGTALSVRGAAAEERKLVTVLFADVAGSTARRAARCRGAEGRDGPASSRRCAAEIEAEGGTVEKFIGDAVMAAFGVPVAHEDDPDRALRAALRMQRRMAELNRRLTDEHGSSWPSGSASIRAR